MTINIIDGNGNTRLNPIAKINSHLDYFRCRAENLTVERFQSLLEFISPHYDTVVGQPWTPGGGAVWFDNKLIGTHGFIGGFTIDENCQVSCMIDLPGEYWEQKDLIAQWRMLRGLDYYYQVKCSRLDLASDDPTFKIIPVREMRESWARGEGFGFRKHTYVESGQNPREMSKTWYFGSRESGKCTRIYNHNNECMRHEVEFKRDCAQTIFKALAELERPPEFNASMQSNELENIGGRSSDDPMPLLIHRTICGFILGAIDFRDRGTRKDVSRVGYRDSRRLPFYQEYIDKVQASVVRVQRKVPVRSLGKTVDWVKRQVSSTLSMFRRGLGRYEFNLWLRDLLEYGEEKSDKLKELWVLEMKKDSQIVRI